MMHVHAKERKERRRAARFSDYFWFGKAWVCRDDAGQLRRLWAPAAASVTDNPAHDAMPVEQYRALQQSIAKRSRDSKTLQRFGWVMLIGGVAAVASNMRPLFQTPHSPSTWFAVLFGALIAFAGWLAIRGVGGDREAIAASLREAGRCPSCAYDLSGTPAGGDGLTRCPECTAQWHRGEAPSGAADAAAT
jgi:hypothetical protein